MAYKYRRGDAKLSGTMSTDDITFSEDSDTLIDFDQDYIGLKTGGNTVLSVSGSQVGIGTPTPNSLLNLNSVQPRLTFSEDGSQRAEIFINDSDNLKIINNTSNQHIVFEISDGGNSREALRLRGHSSAGLPEVVVNEGDSSLIDFRVETDNQTHMIYSDGSLDRVGIMTSAPESSFHIGGSLSLNVTNFNSGNDPGSSYSCTATDCVILINTRPTAQGGIDSTLSITLPDCASAAGRVLIIKDSGGYSDQNAITISRQGSDTISGLHTSVTLSTAGEVKRLISDGDSQWHEI
jgi:hypothetical protein